MALFGFLYFEPRRPQRKIYLRGLCGLRGLIFVVTNPVKSGGLWNPGLCCSALAALKIINPLSRAPFDIESGKGPAA
jgi:hypothetical protein